tara:strand:- start:421 stop:798 length:378 start_codon:yes stop_codon:yes gene_type:complete
VYLLGAKEMTKEFTTVIDMVGRTCIRRCDKEKFIFCFPTDESCKEFILYNTNKFNNHKGFLPDTSVMLPTTIKEENFADVFKVDWTAKKADLQFSGIDTTSTEWKELVKKDKIAFEKKQKRGFKQ